MCASFGIQIFEIKQSCPQTMNPVSLVRWVPEALLEQRATIERLMLSSATVKAEVCN
jgi:hypothetical protein